MRKRKTLKRIIGSLLILFVVVNVICAIHAYKFTHFSNSGVRMENIKLTFWQELRLLFTGIDNPRPVDTITPSRPYIVVKLQSNVTIECWQINTTWNLQKGTVIMFHGYTGNKADLIERAEPFLDNGYNCLLVDFMGSGGSGGNTTTIGYKEAEEVKTCYDYVQHNTQNRIYLYGSSMGAAAIMKAIKDYNIQPKAIIIECPFATLYDAVAIRFRMFHIPAVPLASVMVFWGGVENGFWGFNHNPVDYAASINCPVLLQYGEKDDRVTRSEIDAIYHNIKSPKKLITYPLAGHDNYLKTYKEVWGKNVVDFLDWQ